LQLHKQQKEKKKKELSTGLPHTLLWMLP
jgi:hypothetical protein